MNKFIVVVLMMLIVLIFAAAFCMLSSSGVEGSNNPININGQSQPISNSQTVDATATYGAEQFYIQLTAIADQEQ